MSANYYWLGLAMAVIGAAVAGLAFAQRVFGFSLFESNPLLVGVVIGVAGATLMSQSSRHRKPRPGAGPRQDGGSTG